ncbi:MAG: alpha/beta hydrolase [Sciscionella sp.]
MPLDPQFRTVLDNLASIGALPLVRGSAAQTREHYRSLSLARRGVDYQPEAVESVRDEQIDGPGGELAVRVYRPRHDSGRVVTYFHGGGWVIGDLDTHDPVCRKVANAVGAVTVSVDYRLSPEHPYPAPLQDARAALEWTASQFADRTLGVAGDSAGASLAAAAALGARDDGPRLAAQLLLYPATDPTMSQPSIAENGDGFFLTHADMRWFFEQYAAPVEDPMVNLLHAPVAGVASAVVATAEFDPLRDEGAAYAKRLRAAGVPVAYVPGPGLIHGYFAFLGVVDAADARGGEALAEFGSLLESHERHDTAGAQP